MPMSPMIGKSNQIVSAFALPSGIFVDEASDNANPINSMNLSSMYDFPRYYPYHAGTALALLGAMPECKVLGIPCILPGATRVVVKGPRLSGHHVPHFHDSHGD